MGVLTLENLVVAPTSQILAPGAPAPDFELAAGPGEWVRLRDLRGSNVILAFYPADASPGCTAQLCNYQSELAGFEALGAEVWAISRQSTASHESFARRSKLAFPLLADERGDVVDAYGVSLFGVGVRRSVFVLDAEGVVRWKHVALVGMTYQSAATIQEQLALLPGARGLGGASAAS